MGNLLEVVKLPGVAKPVLGVGVLGVGALGATLLEIGVSRGVPGAGPAMTSGGVLTGVAAGVAIGTSVVVSVASGEVTSTGVGAGVGVGEFTGATGEPDAVVEVIVSRDSKLDPVGLGEVG